MKKLAFILSLIILASCSNEDDSGDVITNEYEQIISILPQNEWKITTLYYAQADHTIEFESFVFTFKEDGTVIGKTDLFTETGTWEYRSTSEKDEQLILEFNGTTPFDKITNEWTIVSLSLSKVELSEMHTDNINTKLLTFSKI